MSGSTDTLALAPQAVFLTVQGEGQMSGLPMVFIRFAGCPVGCKECDTDYTLSSRKTAKEIVREVLVVATPAVRWVWLTGGEPTIHNLKPLLAELHSVGLKVALATAGINSVSRGNYYQMEGGRSVRQEGFDFVSVSPHRIDRTLVQKRGEQVNLVFGLNDLTPEECEPVRKELEAGFSNRFVTTCDGKPETFQQCLDWVYKYSGWRIGHQSHKSWGMK